MPRFDVLDPLHDVMRPHFLEASAGTGKTFSIEHIVARLFLDRRVELQASDILIVTFTRASTRDLKVRIRENLFNILSILKNKQETTPLAYIKTYLSDDKERFASVRKLETILATYDEMEIFTIHGFCSKMLQEYPFEAKMGLSSGSSQDISPKALYRQVILDVLRTQLDEGRFHTMQLHKLLKNVDQDIEKLVKQITGLIEQEVAIEKPKWFYQIRFEMEQLLLEFFPTYQRGCFEEEFRSIALHFKNLANTKKELHPSFLTQVRCFEAYFAQQTDVSSVLEILLNEQEYFFSYLDEKHLKKTTKVSFATLESNTKMIAFARRLNDLLENTLQAPRILLQIAYLCKEAAEKVCCEQGVVSPDHYLMMLKEKLQERPLLEKIRNRYKAALIDEFQDTDPMQWSIFETLFLTDRPGFPLYLVGDPKQSIYSFRNADLPTYLKAKSAFADSDKFSLDTNYRSEPQLIHALNTLFSLSATWLCDHGSLIYEHVHYSLFAKNTTWEDGKKALHFFMAESSHKKTFTAALKAAEEEQFFPFIVEEIKKLSKQGYSYDAFAVLVRDRFQGERLERYFKKHHIPYLATAKVFLGETSAFSFFKLLLRICGKQDLGLIKQLFAHPILGFSHHELKDASPESTFIYALDALKKLVALYTASGFLDFWHHFLQTRFRPFGMVVEKDLLSRGHSQDYFDLIQLGDLLLSKHQKQCISHKELMSMLDEIKNADPEEDPTVCRKPTCDGEAVVVMTIHKSKGLEFKIVFALGACVRGKDRIELIKSKQEQLTQLEVFDSLNPHHQQVIRQEDLEKMRHLYVAFTRAKQRLYVPYLFLEDVKEKSLSPLELFFRKSFSKEGAFSKEGCLQTLSSLEEQGISFNLGFKLQDQICDAKPASIMTIDPPVKFTRNFKQILVDSFSSLHAKEFIKDPTKKLLAPSIIPSSSEVGEIFHKILEKIFERGLYLHHTFEAIHYLIKQEIAYSPLQEFEKPTFDLIEKLLTMRFCVEDITLFFKDIPARSIATEMDFLMQDNQMLYQGVIDLVFVYQGKYFIIDWKTNDLGLDPACYDAPALKQCMQDHHYDKQAKLYIQAMRAFLAKKGLSENTFGGMLYVFLRGLDAPTQGIFVCR